ncbi:MAG: hypothetical protein M1827_003989 [Pycnora praestabilis]|nr:MAG: hypothetical protein M1827_003989 [Pycnora praestabilis]
MPTFEMKRSAPSSVSPASYAKRPKREPSPSPTIRCRPGTAMAESENDVGQNLSDDRHLLSLETQLDSFAALIKEAQARRSREVMEREHEAQELATRHAEAKKAEEQELHSLQHLEAGARDRVMCYLKKIASAAYGKEPLTPSRPPPVVNGNQKQRDDESTQHQNGYAPETYSAHSDSFSHHISEAQAMRMADPGYEPTSPHLMIGGSIHSHEFRNGTSQPLALAHSIPRDHPQFTASLANDGTDAMDENLRPVPSAKAMYLSLLDRFNAGQPRQQADTKPNLGPQERLSPGRLSPLEPNTHQEEQQNRVLGEINGHLNAAVVAPEVETEAEPVSDNAQMLVSHLCPMSLAPKTRCPHGSACFLDPQSSTYARNLARVKALSRAILALPIVQYHDIHINASQGTPNSTPLTMFEPLPTNTPKLPATLILSEAVSLLARLEAENGSTIFHAETKYELAILVNARHRSLRGYYRWMSLRCWIGGFAAEGSWILWENRERDPVFVTEGMLGEMRAWIGKAVGYLEDVLRSFPGAEVAPHVRAGGARLVYPARERGDGATGGIGARDTSEVSQAGFGASAMLRLSKTTANAEADGEWVEVEAENEWEMVGMS